MITKGVKKFHVANLISIAKADGVLTTEEVIFIKSVAIKLGVSSKEFNEVVLNAETVKEETPVTDDGRIQALFNILTMMSLDMNANEEEIRICEHLAELIGFTKEQVDKAIKLSVDNIDNVVTKDQLVAAIR
jgi:uncharacterized tellurite resistance protein B-like protein